MAGECDERVKVKAGDTKNTKIEEITVVDTLKAGVANP